MRVLITGAAGFIGRQVLSELAIQHPQWTLIAADVRPVTLQGLQLNVETVQLDISRPGEVRECVADYRPQAILHLAAVVNPPAAMGEARLHAIEVGGTQALLEAALANGVEQLIVTSSGAAYGYCAQNPEWLDEDQPLAGDGQSAHVRHKREIEQLLAVARVRHPRLRQLVLRPCTILGRRIDSRVSELFDRRAVLGVKGHDSRFVFIWEQDVVNVIRQGLERGREGIFNLAGDGALSLRDIAGLLGKPYRSLPAAVLGTAWRLLKPLGLSRSGAEQLDFLCYRPLLANRRLKESFGYTPRYTSREAFLAYLQVRGIAPRG
ncbi:NAD-dependent epimerase/dehydratase family protein [Pseudomonas benzenivorans]|uniref:NAD-dependent epimerase/dehydratase family protein n=1 Tax=Pseudomonas benzenivorans TaxID=556533 RepID=A0ABY5H1W3_9PSED|nr:NAD-dependent epimerase/dehydratase family protein [Pseudomonas benzenivorans]UTW06038.1 NAD-dependent epimerase/dehydratase family protein [Pseudomonas benzenivorans]